MSKLLQIRSLAGPMRPTSNAGWSSRAMAEWLLHEGMLSDEQTCTRKFTYREVLETYATPFKVKMFQDNFFAVQPSSKREQTECGLCNEAEVICKAKHFTKCAIIVNDNRSKAILPCWVLALREHIQSHATPGPSSILETLTHHWVSGKLRACQLT